MKAIYKTLWVLTILAMSVFVFFETFITWTLFKTQNNNAYSKEHFIGFACTLIITLIISYAGIIILSKLKKWLLTFLASSIWTITNVVVALNLLANTKSADAQSMIIRNHFPSLLLPLLIALLWLCYSFLPEVRHARILKNSERKLRTDERLI